MFANLKKKIEEGSAVSPVGAERKDGNSNSASKTQSASYVHGEGLLFICYEIVHEVQEQTERNTRKSNTNNQDNPAHTLENRSVISSRVNQTGRVNDLF